MKSKQILVVLTLRQRLDQIADVLNGVLRVISGSLADFGLLDRGLELSSRVLKGG